MRSSSPRVLIVWAAAAFAAAAISSPARAAFHLWSIQEVYTNSSGTLQFIELADGPSDPFGGGQNFVGGQTISVTNGTTTNSFTLPPGTLAGSTFNHTLLFGTAGVQAAGGPAPDYIIPNSFLFSSGGTINFFGANSGPYSALPTDGLLSRDWVGGNNSPNSPMNYAGQSGMVIGVPEPSTMLLTPLAVALGGLYRWRSRRRPAAQNTSKTGSA